MRDEFLLVTDGAVRIDEGQPRDRFARTVMVDESQRWNPDVVQRNLASRFGRCGSVGQARISPRHKQISGYSKLLGQFVELVQVGHEDGDADAYRGTLRGDFLDADRRPLRACSAMGQRRAENRDKRSDG